MSNNPKICIAFTGGSAGDFFTQLIYNQLLDKSITPMVDNNGMCLKHPGEKFKKACEAFFLEKFKTNYFTTIDIEPVVNTHHCYQEIIDLFPDCCFYYIDSSQYIPLTVDVFIKKRLDPFNQTLLEWLHETNPFLKNKKMLDMTDNQIRTVMINDYNKCLKEWKKLNLIPIDLADILDKEKCRNLVESIIQLTVKEQKFNQIYDEWISKNLDLVTGVKYKS